MTPIKVHPANSDQDTAIRLFLNALHVAYNSEDEMDETTYLKASPAMEQHINTAITEEDKETGKKISLDDIWK